MELSSALLPALIWIPLLAGVLAWASERVSADLPRWISVAALGLTCVIALMIWRDAETPALLATAADEPAWMLEYSTAWIPQWGISFHLGIDGLGLLMVLLTGALGLFSVLCSWSEIQKRVGFFHFNLLWNLAGVMGVFLALDLFLFFVFWEVMLVPMYFIIALWGHTGANGRSTTYAANKFFIFTQAAGLLMLVAMLALALVHHAGSGQWSFDYVDLLKTEMSAGVEYMLMLAFFIAFAVKLPIVPVHSWLPDAHSQAPTAGSVVLAAILLKTGAYALLRFVLPLFPAASQEFAPVAIFLSVLGILYGAKMALVQTDIKRLVAYTSISHMGFVLLGIYAGGTLALEGAVMLSLAHGLATGGLFILCGALYERLHTRELSRMGAIARRAPQYTTAMMFFSMASLGMPGLGNFVGEFLVLTGSFGPFPWFTAFAALGLILAAIYSLYVIQLALHGAPADDTPVADLNAREKLTLGALMIGLLLLGLFPQPALDITRAPIEQIGQWYAAGVIVK